MVLRLKKGNESTTQSLFYYVIQKIAMPADIKNLYFLSVSGRVTGKKNTRNGGIQHKERERKKKANKKRHE